MMLHLIYKPIQKIHVHYEHLIKVIETIDKYAVFAQTVI